MEQSKEEKLGECFARGRQSEAGDFVRGVACGRHGEELGGSTVARERGGGFLPDLSRRGNRSPRRVAERTGITPPRMHPNAPVGIPGAILLVVSPPRE